MSLFTKKQKQSSQQIVLDTCAVIDGRITAIVKAGFVPGNIIIPQFVIAELQYLADNGDSQKRERARFGLDIIRELQDLRGSDVQIARQKFPSIKEVDDKLVALSKEIGAMLYTTDYNLNKVAQIEGVTVLNVNELAHALRPNHLPGERLDVKIAQTGQEKTQGVGYLDDGTMVVVEKAGNLVGQRIGVELSRMLQTQAGKMLFAIIPANGRQNVPKHDNRNDRKDTKDKVVPSAPTTAPDTPAVPVVNPQTAQPRPQNQPQTRRPRQLEGDRKQFNQRKPRSQNQQSNAQANPRPGAQGNQNRPAQPNNRRQNFNRKRISPEDSLLNAINQQEQQTKE